jgi:capsular exopolysaccharide synthesis family protein
LQFTSSGIESSGHVSGKGATLLSAIDFGNQEPEQGSEVHRELMSPRSLPRPGEDWLRNAESIDAHISSDARLVMHNDPYSMAADRYRLLRMHLAALGKMKRLKVVMVTSAMPQEGKTVTALNLAVALSERSAGVVVIEMDLRRPALAKRLGVKARSGLVQCMQEGRDPLSAVCRVNPLGIYLLASGGSSSNPIELINGDGFAKTIQQLRAAFEWVIIDAPPVIPVPDVLALRSLADGWIWVMRAHKTSREMARDAMDQIGTQRILGVVLNEAADRESLYSSYYDGPSPPMLSSGR